MALQHLSSSYDLERAGDLHFSEELDVSELDPFVKYINEALMEEGMEDNTCKQQEAEASYRSIIESLYGIIGECPPPPAALDSSIGDYRGIYEEHANIAKSNFGMIHDVGVSRAVIGNLPVGLQQGRAEVSRSNNEVAQVSVQAVTENPSGFDPTTAMGGLEQGICDFKTLSLVEKYVSLEDLKVKAGYTELYIGKPGTSTAVAKPIGLNGEQKKPPRAALQGKRKGNGDMLGFVDIREVLLSCAQAVAMGDVKKAREILHELYHVHGASANGNALQRVAHYFSDALVSRLGGLGGNHYRTMCNIVPSAGLFLKALKEGYEVSPYKKIQHYFANQSILKAAEGTSRLHIVDYGLLFGMQWPCLINALADRRGGPPLLVITCIDYPQRSANPAERPEEIGRRLAAYARTYNVPFQYHAIAPDRWEDINSASLHLLENEVLVVNCMNCLHILPDEAIDMTSTNSRDKSLSHIHSLNPHLLLTSHFNGTFNSPFFVSRFREALYYFSNIFDMFEVVWGDSPERLFIERSCYALDILNVVACEGAERVQRPETYKQWGIRTRKAGFQQLAISARIVSISKFHVKQQFHKDFLVHDDAEGWLFLGWKGRTMMAMSAWMSIPL